MIPLLSARGPLHRVFLPAILSLALVGSAAALTPGSTTLFLAGENVRQEVGITPTQARALDRLRRELREEIRPFCEARNAAAASMIAASVQTYDEKALALLTPAQRQKLRRVEARALGPWLLHSPSVQTELNLSDSQVRRIEAIAQRVERYNQRQHRRVDRGRITPAARLHLVREYRLSQNPKLLSILTPEQLQAFQALSN